MPPEPVTRLHAAGDAPAWLGNTQPALRRAWHPVATAEEVAAKDGAPLRVLLLDEPWVLVTLGRELRAFPDRCPHRRVPLSAGEVVGGVELQCIYHGWRFDAMGSCTAVPALGPGATPPRGMRLAPAYGVQVRYGLVWLAPEEPVTDIPALPECEDSAYAWTLLPARRTSASAGVVIDNFYDVAHFSYLHGSSFGVTQPVTVERYEVSRDGWTTRLVHEATVREDLGGLRRVATYTMTAPFAMHLSLAFPETGLRSLVAFVATPETATSTVVRKLVAWPAADGPQALAEQVDAEIRILEEDIAVLELLDEPALALDLRLEQHTKADRASVELRRLLADLCTDSGSDHT
jgi:vanillate O-demethylase monooxygenase subunit